MADCIFCKIVKKEVKADFLFENERVVAFKDIRPSAPVHILVVPQEHIQSIAHIEGNHKEIISELIFTAKGLAQKAGLNGYKLVFNVGREGGQVIDHLHLHILGGWTGKKDRAAMIRLGLDI
ncbi:MAG: HIT domain-containing protein [bacterium]|nr:HIT domain-containing protein [bacterium]